MSKSNKSVPKVKELTPPRRGLTLSVSRGSLTGPPHSAGGGGHSRAGSVASRSSFTEAAVGSKHSGSHKDTKHTLSEEDKYFHNQLKKKVFSEKTPYEKQKSSTYVSEATRLLSKIQEIDELGDFLVSQKSEYEKLESDFHNRESELVNKEKLLKKSFVKCERFFLDNDAKLQAEQRKFLRERETRESWLKEIGRLDEDLQQLGLEKEKKQAAMETLLPYMLYLKQTLEKSQEFGDLRTLIDRYQQLQLTAGSLDNAPAEDQQINQDRELQLSFAQEFHKGRAEIVVLENRISTLQKEMKEIEHEVDEEELKLDETSRASVERSLRFAQITMASDNMVRRICEHTRTKYRIQDTTMQQLDSIKDQVVDVRDIVECAGLKGGLARRMREMNL